MKRNSPAQQEAIRALLAQNGRRFMSITFTKGDGTERVLNGRLNMGSRVKGTGKSSTAGGKYVNVYDVVADGFRKVNLETISKVRCMGLEVNI